MPTPLSDLERRILDYLVQYLRSNTYQPSIREIGEEFDIKSTKTVSEHLGALAEKGYVERDPSRSRGVKILGMDLSPETISVPCYVAIPDGQGFASDGVEAYYSIDRRMAGAQGSYFLRVRGDELQSLDVEQGDFLLVEPAGAERAQEGDLLVLQRPEGVGLYRYSGCGDHCFLESAGNGTPPFAVASRKDLDVEGRVAGLFRSFGQSAIPVSAPAH